MAKAQELLVLLWGNPGLPWQPDQLMVACLGGQHSIALVTRQV